jgi:hypothetical protein
MHTLQYRPGVICKLFIEIVSIQGKVALKAKTPGLSCHGIAKMRTTDRTKERNVPSGT